MSTSGGGRRAADAAAAARHDGLTAMLRGAFPDTPGVLVAGDALLDPAPRETKLLGTGALLVQLLLPAEWSATWFVLPRAKAMPARADLIAARDLLRLLCHPESSHRAQPAFRRALATAVRDLAAPHVALLAGDAPLWHALADHLDRSTDSTRAFAAEFPWFDPHGRVVAVTGTSGDVSRTYGLGAATATGS